MGLRAGFADNRSKWVYVGLGRLRWLSVDLGCLSRFGKVPVSLGRFRGLRAGLRVGLRTAPASEFMWGFVGLRGFRLVRVGIGGLKSA